VFITVRSPSLELKGSTTIARGSTLTVGVTTVMGDTTMAYMTTTAMGGTETLADMTMTAMGDMTVADTTTTAMTGTTTLHDVGNGSSGGNVAPAIPISIVARAQGPIAFLEECVAILSQRADEAAVFAREVVADAQDFNNAHASIFAKHRKMFLQRTFGINPDETIITDVSTLHIHQDC